MGNNRTFTRTLNFLAAKQDISSASVRVVIGLFLLLCVATTGCSFVEQIEHTSDHAVIRLGPDDLEKYGIGFLTPSAATGREADKQALAMSFSFELQKMRPDAKVLSLPQVLNAMNAADLDAQYKKMYRDYLETGILEGSILERISEITDVRYFAQLSLSDFRQTSSGRLSLFGLRIAHTEVAKLRVFVQIWDAQNAEIAWEGLTELSYAYDTGKEKAVTFSDVSKLAAEQLFSNLPGNHEELDPE